MFEDLDLKEDNKNSETDLNQTTFLLSTIDNPFNPFDDFINWFSYDTLHNYNTCGLISKYVNVNEDQPIPDSQYRVMVSEAMNKILSSDPFGIRIKVKRDDEIKPVSIEDFLNQIKEIEK